MKLNSLRMLLVSLVVAAVILTVTLVSGFGPGNATDVEASGPKQHESTKVVHDSGKPNSSIQSFGGTWSGWD